MNPAVISSKILFVAISLALVSCAEDDSSSSSVVDLAITASTDANEGTSYTKFKTDIWINYQSLVLAGEANLRDAIAYLDADGDGDTDIFMASGTFFTHNEMDSSLFINNGTGTFSSSTVEFDDNMPVSTHARKSIVGDFDNNGLDDVFVFDHGFDANPFPGENPKLILQNTVGKFSWTKLLDQTGFHHGGASADIDNDGDMDIFVGGFDPFFFVNDGNANFTLKNDRTDSNIDKVFSAELIDVDKDGFVDLLTGAHEREGNKTSIYWGSTKGSYSSSNRTVIPAVTSFGAILDFDAEDIDGNGTLDLFVNRTRDGDDGIAKGFYQGRTIQLLQHDGNRGFTDISASNINAPGGDDDEWFPWLRVQDIDEDGDVDMASDDQGDGVSYLNDGNGFFTRQ